MTEAPGTTGTARPVRAFSALAGLAPLGAYGIVPGVVSVLMYVSRFDPTANPRLMGVIMNVQTGVSLIAVGLVSVLTGMVLARSGSVRWGVCPLLIVGGIDALGRLASALLYSGAGAGEVSVRFFAYGAPILAMALLVVVGGWLGSRRVRSC